MMWWGELIEADTLVQCSLGTRASLAKETPNG